MSSCLTGADGISPYYAVFIITVRQALCKRCKNQDWLYNALRGLSVLILQVFTIGLPEPHPELIQGCEGSVPSRPSIRLYSPSPRFGLVSPGYPTLTCVFYHLWSRR